MGASRLTWPWGRSGAGIYLRDCFPVFRISSTRITKPPQSAAPEARLPRESKGSTTGLDPHKPRFGHHYGLFLTNGLPIRLPSSMDKRCLPKKKTMMSILFVF